MAFYGEMPDMYNIVLNSDHKLIQSVLSATRTAAAAELKPVDAEISGLTARRDAINQANSGKKYDEITQESKDELSKCEQDIEAQKKLKNDIIARHAADNKAVHQLLDLALLQNGMLKGEALSNFVKRSIDMI
jgi:molecular chaperone HtpG